MMKLRRKRDGAKWYRRECVSKPIATNRPINGKRYAANLNSEKIGSKAQKKEREKLRTERKKHDEAHKTIHVFIAAATTAAASAK